MSAATERVDDPFRAVGDHARTAIAALSAEVLAATQDLSRIILEIPRASPAVIVQAPRQLAKPQTCPPALVKRQRELTAAPSSRPRLVSA